MTNQDYLKNLRRPSKENPCRILMSVCLTGFNCGFDGTSYGEHLGALKLLTFENIKIVKFCPEDFSCGTPREIFDIHGGTGFEVLDGTAKVLTETGIDGTVAMRKPSEKMLEFAQR
ncbi:2-thiouracil desulfurase family protein [Chryseobacterium sp. MP_3.2]|uniref:2-thiouracil desulfurase family protein n=1 Tax=Chryseobacterium sp. MP_3.2 TaxID=3071712 RepID=UPI002E0AA915|nr:uncharacterized protein YbbK (DUF523 family) [Chryseobacterium sp. MP_3.2]